MVIVYIKNVFSLRVTHDQVSQKYKNHVLAYLYIHVVF
jgi:hypothetical protein